MIVTLLWAVEVARRTDSGDHLMAQVTLPGDLIEISKVSLKGASPFVLLPTPMDILLNIDIAV